MIVEEDTLAADISVVDTLGVDSLVEVVDSHRAAVHHHTADLDRTTCRLSAHQMPTQGRIRSS